MQLENKDNILLAIGEGVAGLYVPEPMLCSEWAEKHFYLSNKSSGLNKSGQIAAY